MLKYDQLKTRPRDFLAATGLQPTEFEHLLGAFETAYRQQYPLQRTLEGKTRQRQAGAGAKAKLESMADKLLFILVYTKTNPLQTLHALQFGLSQGQANHWIHRLLPVLQAALRALGQAPERTAAAVATHALAQEAGANLVIDGTERPRQRPQQASRQKAHYSGKKKTHTDKNIVLVNANSGKVVYLGETVPGKTHDKKAADQAEIAYPAGATLDKDTGFQGYEPHGVLTAQPKKSRVARNWALLTSGSTGSSRVRAWSLNTSLRGSSGAALSKMNCA
jgi:hypothetical protein